MKLIDADLLIDMFKNDITKTEQYINTSKYVSDEIKKRYEKIIKIFEEYIKIIEHLPPAYDVDKVVEQLENKKFTAFMTLANTGNEQLDITYENVGNYIDNAIEIVKAGGIDEKN